MKLVFSNFMSIWSIAICQNRLFLPPIKHQKWNYFNFHIIQEEITTIPSSIFYVILSKINVKDPLKNRSLITSRYHDNNFLDIYLFVKSLEALSCLNKNWRYLKQFQKKKRVKKRIYKRSFLPFSRNQLFFPDQAYHFCNLLVPSHRPKNQKKYSAVSLNM